MRIFQLYHSDNNLHLYDEILLMSALYQINMLSLLYAACLTRKNCFRYLKLMSPLKNNYLTLRSKVKVPRRSLWYVTHHLMVMHPHTKYHWPIWKDKKSYGPDKLRWEEAEEEERRRKNQTKTICLPSFEGET
jgi:hypothetical protein